MKYTQELTKEELEAINNSLNYYNSLDLDVGSPEEYPEDEKNTKEAIRKLINNYTNLYKILQEQQKQHSEEVEKSQKLIHILECIIKEKNEALVVQREKMKELIKKNIIEHKFGQPDIYSYDLLKCLMRLSQNDN